MKHFVYLSFIISLTASGAVLSQPCDINYEGACVPANVSDVDCASGRGNGPYYLDQQVRVVGQDHYGLDRDKNGIGCEAERLIAPRQILPLS
jgi:hypothetical protein